MPRVFALASAIAEALLLILATTWVFIPEARSPALRAACAALLVAILWVDIRRLWKAGLLTLTPAQILRLTTHPRQSLLGLVAIAMAGVALLVH